MMLSSTTACLPYGAAPIIGVRIDRYGGGRAPAADTSVRIRAVRASNHRPIDCFVLHINVTGFNLSFTSLVLLIERNHRLREGGKWGVGFKY
jgi:hypothetical protein